PLVALGERETPWIWTLADGKRVNPYDTRDPNGRTHGVTPNGQWHETSDRDDAILLRLWNLPDARAVRPQMLPNFGWDQIEFSPDDRLVAITHFGCDPKPPRLVVWDTHTNTRRRGFAVPGIVVRPVAFSPDGRILTSCD